MSIGAPVTQSYHSKTKGNQACISHINRLGPGGTRRRESSATKVRGKSSEGSNLWRSSATPRSSYTPTPLGDGVRAAGAGHLSASLVPLEQRPVLPLGSLRPSLTRIWTFPLLILSRRHSLLVRSGTWIILEHIASSCELCSCPLVLPRRDLDFTGKGMELVFFPQGCRDLVNDQKCQPG